MTDPLTEPQVGPDGERLEGVDYSDQSWLVGEEIFRDVESATQALVNNNE